MREEFEKQQKGNTLANTLSGSGGGFDAAAWLAGSNTDAQTGSGKITGSETKGNGGGGKTRRR